MFSGIFLFLKDKNDITIPNEWIKNFKDNRVVIGLFPEGCIFVYPLKSWVKLSPMRDICLAEREDRKNLRVIFSRAKEKRIEKGAVNIAEFVERISNPVLLAGCGDYFEIWKEKEFERELEENMRKTMSKGG